MYFFYHPARFFHIAALMAAIWVTILPQAEADTLRPSLSDKEVSILHFNLIQQYFESSGSKHSFFSSGQDLNGILLQELGLFLEQYRHLPIAAKAQFLKGRLLLSQGDEEKAAIAWLQVWYEYPESESAIGAKAAPVDFA